MEIENLMFTVYFWIDGQGFDADRFQSGLANQLTGSVETRKRVKDDQIERYGKYWVSEVRKSIVDAPEDELAALLSRYKAEILRAKSEGNDVSIVAEIVEEYDNVEDVRGLYLTPNLVKLLAELGMAVDIDIVRRLH